MNWRMVGVAVVVIGGGLVVIGGGLVLSPKPLSSVERPRPVILPAPKPELQVAAVVEPKPDPTCPAVKRITFIGDSYAEGVAPHLKPFMKACNVEYAFDARRGTSVTQWIRDTWIGPVLDAKPEVVIISLGGNDFQRLDTDVVLGAVDTLVARIQSAGARVLWVEPLSLPYRDLAGVRPKWKAVMGDDWFPSEHLEYKRYSDKVHTLYSNYREWAKLIWPWLVKRTHDG